MKKWIITFACPLLWAVSFAQTLTTEEYIARYKNDAIESMKLKKIPASITLAQGILESSSGNSPLATQANNHFGIKCHKEWKGETYYQDDDAPNECFRKYKHVIESYKDHGDFLTSRERYKGLFALEITDYKGWANGLKAAGYATNPKYPELLINLIERYQLYQYDQMAMGQTPNQNDVETPPVKDTQDKTQQNTSKSTSQSTENQVPVNKGNTNAQQNQSPNSNTSQIKNKGTLTTKVSDEERAKTVFINGLKAIRVGKNASKKEIAESNGITVSNLHKYNDLKTSDELKPGQIVFVEPKRSSAAADYPFHTVKAGDTWHSIAQQYGVYLKMLLKKNNASTQTELKVGDTIWLRKQKKS